ncbi:MAG: adenylyltransferase/cytidyltransferase family protein [Candidatus Absconditabacterales bacterium]|nr:adenylyltransferase/cytidyltransferase family protein [Candidatus Absconditabacterales bacterium]
MLTNVHPNIFSGPVIHGKKHGRQIGFPTANVFLETNKKPHPGTYGCICLLGTFASLRDDDVIIMGKKWATARIEGLACFREGTDILEVHLLDRSGDLYEHTITVSLLTYLRPNYSFSSREQLASQIHHDLQTWANTRLIGMNFGTFDYLHHGHLRYCTQASLMSKHLITIVSHDTHRKPDTQKSMAKRINDLTAWKLPQHTILGGHPHDYLFYPHHYRPEIFFLGYDQPQGKERLSQYRYDSKVCHIDAYEPHRFKSSHLKKTSISS